ncbi:MAG: DUF2442 domain-containing protein [Cetobacterium sp.]
MKYPKIKKIKVLDNYFLEVLFDNGIIKKYNFSSNFKYEIFLPLKDYALFKEVQVDAGGYGISWNDDLDLSEYELWINGTEREKL